MESCLRKQTQVSRQMCTRWWALYGNRHRLADKCTDDTPYTVKWQTQSIHLRFWCIYFIHNELLASYLCKCHLIVADTIIVNWKRYKKKYETIGVVVEGNCDASCAWKSPDTDICRMSCSQAWKLCFIRNLVFRFYLMHIFCVIAVFGLSHVCDKYGKFVNLWKKEERNTIK